MHTHRSGRLIKLARNVHLSRFRAPNKDFIDFFIPFSVSYGMALSLQRLVSVCPSLMLSKLFAWCSQAIHWSVVVIVGATANFFPATFSLSIRIAFFIILWGIWMRFFSSHLFLLYGIAITLIIANGWSEKSVRLNARKRNIRETNW